MYFGRVIRPCTYLAILSLAALVAVPFAVNASQTDGTIDPVSRYAWSENAGFIDFGTTLGNVHVTDSGLTGYAWGENVGWISLNCSNTSSCGTVNYGVTNNDGTLSGFAYGENIGWIDFAPSGSGVVINNSGVFTGDAFSENIGWIVFAGANVATTDWRPLSARGSSPSPSTSPLISAAGGSQSSSGSVVGGSYIGPSASPQSSAWALPRTGVANPPAADSASNGVTGIASGIYERNAQSPLAPPAGTVPSAPPSAQQTSMDLNGSGLGNGNSRGIGNGTGVSTGMNMDALSAAIPNILASLWNIVNQIVTSSRGLIALGGLAAGMAVILNGIFVAPTTLSDLIYAPGRFFGFFSAAVGLKKRLVPWGTVYDSVTKQPVDPAIVTIADAQGNDVTDVITDLDGRYGALLQAGTYTMTAGKTNFTFPSRKLAGHRFDELYDNLYFGEPITITDRQPIVKKDIPLDPVDFDWNEFAKRDQHLMQYFSKRELWMLRIGDLIFALGLVIAVFALIIAFSIYNLVVLAVYLALLASRFLVRDPRSFGAIRERRTGQPLSFAIIRVFTPDRATQITQKVADKFGRYFCLITDGSYAVTVDRKNADESYSTVYDAVIKVKGGILKKKIYV